MACVISRTPAALTSCASVSCVGGNAMEATYWMIREEDDLVHKHTRPHKCHKLRDLSVRKLGRAINLTDDPYASLSKHSGTCVSLSYLLFNEVVTSSHQGRSCTASLVLPAVMRRLVFLEAARLLWILLHAAPESLLLKP